MISERRTFWDRHPILGLWVLVFIGLPYAVVKYNIEFLPELAREFRAHWKKLRAQIRRNRFKSYPAETK